MRLGNKHFVILCADLCALNDSFQLNVLLLSSSELLASGFERATVLSIEDASSSEEENNRAAGIEIEALVQFNEDGVSSDEYSRIWEELTSNGRMSENVKVDKSGDYLETIKGKTNLRLFSTLFMSLKIVY